MLWLVIDRKNLEDAPDSVETPILPNPKESRDKVLQRLQEHHKWFSESNRR